MIFPVCPGWPIFPSLWLAWAPAFLPQFSLIFEFQVFSVAKVQFTLLTPLDSVFKLELSRHPMLRVVSWYQIGLFWCQLASMITRSHLRCLYRILAHTKAAPLSLLLFLICFFHLLCQLLLVPLDLQLLLIISAFSWLHAPPLHLLLIILDSFGHVLIIACVTLQRLLFCSLLLLVVFPHLLLKLASVLLLGRLALIRLLRVVALRCLLLIYWSLRVLL